MVVEQELGKVPFDGRAKGACQLCLEELEDGVGVSTVDVDLGEDREGSVVRRRRKLEDLLVGAGFLLSKLVAREGQDFESFILVGLIKGLKLGVVDVGLASLGGDVDNDANLSPIV